MPLYTRALKIESQSKQVSKQTAILTTWRLSVYQEHNLFVFYFVFTFVVLHGNAKKQTDMTVFDGFHTDFFVSPNLSSNTQRAQ